MHVWLGTSGKQGPDSADGGAEVSEDAEAEEEDADGSAVDHGLTAEEAEEAEGLLRALQAQEEEKLPPSQGGSRLGAGGWLGSSVTPPWAPGRGGFDEAELSAEQLHDWKIVGWCPGGTRNYRRGAEFPFKPEEGRPCGIE